MINDGWGKYFRIGNYCASPEFCVPAGSVLRTPANLSSLLYQPLHQSIPRYSIIRHTFSIRINYHYLFCAFALYGIPLR